MSDQDMFDQILASLYDAMLDDAAWPATSALLDEACGMQGNALFVRNGPPDNVQVNFVGLYYRGERREDWEREYLGVYHPIDERVPRLMQLPDSHLVRSSDLYTAEELQTSLAYNEGLYRGSAQKGVNARLDGPDGSIISWVTADPVAAGGWESSQLALMKRLLPHIRQFVRVRQALVSAGARGVSEIGLLANTQVGVIHLDRRGCIMEANDRARALLRQGDVVEDQGGELQARQPNDRARLARLLAGALPTSSAPAVSGSIALHCASRVPLFVVHVKPMRVRQPDFGARRAAALVLIAEVGSVSRINPAFIAELLGLTPLESHVAVRVAEGRSVREIAGALGQTEGAVRWHLHQIYRKHECTRQADLVRLVLSVAPFA